MCTFPRLLCMRPRRTDLPSPHIHTTRLPGWQELFRFARRHGGFRGSGGAGDCQLGTGDCVPKYVAGVCSKPSPRNPLEATLFGREASERPSIGGLVEAAQQQHGACIASAAAHWELEHVRTFRATVWGTDGRRNGGGRRPGDAAAVPLSVGPGRKVGVGRQLASLLAPHRRPRERGRTDGATRPARIRASEVSACTAGRTSARTRSRGGFSFASLDVAPRPNHPSSHPSSHPSADSGHATIERPRRKKKGEKSKSSQPRLAEFIDVYLLGARSGEEDGDQISASRLPPPAVRGRNSGNAVRVARSADARRDGGSDSGWSCPPHAMHCACADCWHPSRPSSCRIDRSPRSHHHPCENTCRHGDMYSQVDLPGEKETRRTGGTKVYAGNNA